MPPKGPKALASGENAVKPEKPKSEKRGKKEPKKSKAQKQLEKQASNIGAPAAAAPAAPNNNNQANSNNAILSNKKAPKKRAPPPPPFANGRPPQLDPLLLARGMSSRYLSSKISHQLTPLAKDSVEKDLRHMEAYRNACNGYSQQLFVFKNQELVRSGYFGTFAPFPVEDSNVIRPIAPASSMAAASTVGKSGGGFSMPIKIDPEEEKRLSMLRKEIHQSEFEREKLETEYLSLRAHYVHETQLARKTRAYEMGRWTLLRELMNRRAKVLGLMRAKIGMGRDVEKLLKYRGELAVKAKNGEANGGETKIGAAAGIMNGSGHPNNGTNAGVAAASASTGQEKKASEKAVDLIEIWNGVNAQLKQAELACTEIETPAVLSQMVMRSSSDQTSSNGIRSRSPTRNDGDKNAKSRKRSSSITSTEEASNSATATESGSGSSNHKKSKSPIPHGLEPHVIPWDCMVEPQTPFDVPLLLSCLSSATDRAVGFVTDKTNPTAITWLESTLPSSTSAYKSDVEDLAKSREEVRILEEELNSESVRNTELQKQIIASRGRSDEMVAMMQLLRSETEAVLERHNIIMDTPEARAKSAALHNRLLAEQNLNNPSAAGEEMEEEEEGEVDELNEDLSSGEDDQDEDEEEDRSDDDSVGIKEITVDKDAASNNVAAGEGEEESDVDEIDEDDGSEEEGEIAEDGEVVGEEDDEPSRRSKRRNQGEGGEADEESSSLTPPNDSSSHRKRRRF